LHQRAAEFLTKAGEKQKNVFKPQRRAAVYFNTLAKQKNGAILFVFTIFC